MALKPVSLDDKYDLAQERVFVSCTQALVRLALMQKERDRRAGPDANQQKRGRVSRELRAELEEALGNGND